MHQQINSRRENRSVNALIQQIASLDTRYEEGKLAELTYRQQCETLKIQLAVLFKEQGKLVVETEVNPN